MILEKNDYNTIYTILEKMRNKNSKLYEKALNIVKDDRVLEDSLNDYIDSNKNVFLFEVLENLDRKEGFVENYEVDGVELRDIINEILNDRDLMEKIVCILAAMYYKDDLQYFDNSKKQLKAIGL